MLIMFNIILFILFLLLIMILINYLIFKKMNINREKMSPFECGFDPMSLNRMPFSLHFYLIGILFLIFDVEISLVLPMIKSFNYMNLSMNLNFYLILLILLLGLLIEWKEGALSWMK